MRFEHEAIVSSTGEMDEARLARATESNPSGASVLLRSPRPARGGSNASHSCIDLRRRDSHPGTRLGGDERYRRRVPTALDKTAVTLWTVPACPDGPPRDGTGSHRCLNAMTRSCFHRISCCGRVGPTSIMLSKPDDRPFGAAPRRRSRPVARPIWRRRTRLADHDLHG
jgi:hypothetical protein